jgi:hypothetical protein
MKATVHKHKGVSGASLQPSAPQQGDVVVAREKQSREHYTVRQLPGSVQFSAGAREDAVRLALGFGQKYAVDVWYSESGTYLLLAAHRPQTLAQSPRHRLGRNTSED